MELTEESKKLFMHFAKDSFNWKGQPMLDINKEQRGNLTQLKKADLVYTFETDGCWFVGFTDKGLSYANENGIDIEE